MRSYWARIYHRVRIGLVLVGPYCGDVGMAADKEMGGGEGATKKHQTKGGGMNQKASYSFQLIWAPTQCS
jgi:hypothetical protein